MLAAVRETCSKLAEHNEREHDRFSGLEHFDCFDDAFAEVDVSIRVDRDPHFQSFSSTRS
jgi:hypothetical protein